MSFHVSEGGLEGLLPSPEGVHRWSRAMATSGVTSTISAPTDGTRPPPQITNCSCSPRPRPGGPRCLRRKCDGDPMAARTGTERAAGTARSVLQNGQSASRPPSSTAMALKVASVKPASV